MDTDTLAALQAAATTDESADDCDCDDLPDGMPCAACYIHGTATWEGP